MVGDYLTLLVLGEHELLHHPSSALKRPLERPRFTCPNEGDSTQGITASIPAVVPEANDRLQSPVSKHLSPPVRASGEEANRPVVIRTSPSKSEQEYGKPDRSYTYISERLRSFLEFDGAESSCNSDVAPEWKSQEVVYAAAPFKTCTGYPWDAGSPPAQGQLPHFHDAAGSDAHTHWRHLQRETGSSHHANSREEASQDKNGRFTCEGPLFSHEYCYCQHVGLRNTRSRGKAVEPDILQSGFDAHQTSGERDDEVPSPPRIQHPSVKHGTMPQTLEDTVVLASHSGKPRRLHRRTIVVEAPRHLVAAAASVSGKIYRKLSRFSQLPLTAGSSSPPPVLSKPHNATAFVVTNTRTTPLASTHVKDAGGLPSTTSLVRAAYPRSRTAITFASSRGTGASGNGASQAGQNKKAAGSLVTIPCIQGALGVRQQSGAYVPPRPSMRECQDKQMQMAPQALSYRRSKPSGLVEPCVVISESDDETLSACQNLGTMTESPTILQPSTATLQQSVSQAQVTSVSVKVTHTRSTHNEVVINSSASRASCVLSPSRSRLVENLLRFYSSSASSASSSSYALSVSPSLKRVSRPKLSRSYASSETTASQGTEARHVLPPYPVEEPSHIIRDEGSMCIADDNSSNALGVVTSSSTPSNRGFSFLNDYQNDTTAAVVSQKDGGNDSSVDFYRSLVPLISWEYFSAASPSPTVLTTETATNASGSVRVGHASCSTGPLSQGKPAGSSIGLGLQIGKELLQDCRATSFKGLLQYLSVARSIQRIALSFQRVHRDYFDLHHPDETMAMAEAALHSGSHIEATGIKGTYLPSLHSPAPCGRLQCIAACWLEVVSFVNGILELQIKQRRGFRNWSTSSSKVAATSSAATAARDLTHTSNTTKTVGGDFGRPRGPSCTTVLSHFKEICSPDALFFTGANGSFRASTENVPLPGLTTIPSFVAAPSAHWIVFLAFWLERKLHLVHTGINCPAKKTPHGSVSPNTTMTCWKPYQLVQDFCCCWPLARTQPSPSTAGIPTAGIKSRPASHPMCDEHTSERSYLCLDAIHFLSCTVVVGSEVQRNKVSCGSSSLDVCTDQRKKGNTPKHHCYQQSYLLQDYTPEWKSSEKQHASRWGAQIDIIRRFLVLCFCAWSWAEDEATTSGSLAAILQHVWWCTNTQIDLGLSDLATRLRTLHANPQSISNPLLTSSSSSSSFLASSPSQGASGSLASFSSSSTGASLEPQLPDAASDTSGKYIRSSKSFHWVSPVLTCHKKPVQSFICAAEVDAAASNKSWTRARSGQYGGAWTPVLSPHSTMVSVHRSDISSATLSPPSKQSPPPSCSTAAVSISLKNGSFRPKTLTPLAAPLPKSNNRPIACRIRQTLCDAVFRRSRLFAHRKDAVTPDYVPPTKCRDAETYKEKKAKKDKLKPLFSKTTSPCHGSALQESRASQPYKQLFPASSSSFHEATNCVPDYYGEYLALPTCWSADDIEAQTFAILDVLCCGDVLRKALITKFFPLLKSC